MKKTIMMIKQVMLSLLYCCLLTTTTIAQLQKYAEIYPPLPFELQKAEDGGYRKCTVWRGIYNEGNNDVSGEMWSNTLEESYQFQKYIFGDGKVDLITTYYPRGKKWSMEFFYQQNLLSGIEKLNYDSLQEPHLDFTYAYMYKHDGTPFQRVKQFGYPNKGVRLLEEFEFDTLQRVVRQKATAVGHSLQMDSLVGLQDQEKMLTLSEYEDSTFARRIYKNLHVIMEDSKSYYNSEGLIGKTELRNAEGKLIVTIDYEYDGGRLIKKTHWVTRNLDNLTPPKEEDEKKKKKKKKEENNNAVITEVVEPTVPKVYKREYFFYNDEGFVEKLIVEENSIQLIYEYTFFTE